MGPLQLLSASSRIFVISSLLTWTWRCSCLQVRTDVTDGDLDADSSFEGQLDRNGDCMERTQWVGPAVTAMHPQAQADWVAIPLPEEKNLSPKPAFLMMIYETIVFENAWEALIDGAGNASFGLHIHSKSNSPKLSARMLPYLVKEKIPTLRCHDVDLMIYLMSLALEDENVSHVMVVSGDTMPLRPFSHMVRDLSHEPRSSFCTDTDWQRAETWIMLQRVHAELYVTHSTELRAMIPTTDCEDEDMFYWPLKEREEDIIDRCLMMTDWSGTPKFWAINAKKCECPEFIASVKKHGDCGRPSLFFDVTERGLYSLLASPAGHWFVRKFPGDGVAGVVTYQGNSSLDVEMASRLILSGTFTTPPPIEETVTTVSPESICEDWACTCQDLANCIGAPDWDTFAMAPKVARVWWVESNCTSEPNGTMCPAAQP